MNFELWLFAIKHLGTTMDVAKTIFDSMSPDRQKSLRDEYERQYNCGNAEEKKALSNRIKVKITVLKTECFKELQTEYFKEKERGTCPYFKEGQEFIVDEENYRRCMHGKLCSEAWEILSKYIYTVLHGGSFSNTHTKDENVMIVCCNSGTRPVIFKLEKVDR